MQMEMDDFSHCQLFDMDTLDKAALKELDVSFHSIIGHDSGSDLASQLLYQKRKKKSKLTTSKSQKPQNKKPLRPCLYCKKFVTKLNRHLEIRHSKEDKVCEALKKSNKAKLKIFADIRKEGIYQHNMKMLKEGKPLICERKEASEGLKVCTACHAFIRRKYFFSHSKTCGKLCGSTPNGFQLELIDESDCIDFADMLSRFNHDEAGKNCKNNLSIRLIGKSQFNKHRKKQSKRTAARKAVMIKMRTLANLYLEFLRCAKDKSLPFEAMFLRRHFLVLEEAVQNMTSHEDGTLKPGIKLLIGSLLKLSAKVLKGSFLIEDRDEDADTVDKFVSVLQLRWTSMFGDAEYQVLHNRNSNLREPVKLPDENDVQTLRNSTIAELQKLLQDKYLLPTADLFIGIRDLVISRLTLFNARRGGEPSRLLVKDWVDAKNDKWIDFQRTDNLSPMKKSLLKTFKVIY